MVENKSLPKIKQRNKSNLILVISVVFIILVFLIAGIFIEVSNQNRDYVVKPYNQKMLTVETNELISSLTKTIELDKRLPFSQAQFYFQSSKFDLAYQALLPYALEGNSIAQLEVGFLREFGLGVKKDLHCAALWYFLAARPNVYNEHAYAWGVDYYFGLSGKKKNMAKAALWFRMAAELSNDQY
ncbi:hypothetical protein L3V82_12110 [Thiotrichales bacterium 19S3-7]|nr:hypothetical protein [Thiotrichales bacterium 19S3-7]MCF6802938.1 hypothetical protein [Thiotrichales bacterium 19S3-11]